MGFCLLRRDGDAVELITQSVYETRAGALAEISRLSEDDELGAAEVFMVDIDAATPVLIVSQRPATTSPQPAPTEPVPSGPDEQVGPEPEEAAPVPAEDSVVALGMEDAVAQPEIVAVETAIADAVLQQAVDEEVQAEVDLPSEEPSPHAWPWDTVAEPEVSSQTDAEPEGEALLEEVEQTEADVEVVAEPETDDVPDEVDSTEEPVDLSEATDTETEPADELPDEVSGLLADLEEIVPSVPVALEPEPGAGSAETPADVSEEVELDADASDEPPKAYEAGASDITELTCEDCIYLNTCPKKGESDPSNCGSFQWKSI